MSSSETLADGVRRPCPRSATRGAAARRGRGGGARPAALLRAAMPRAGDERHGRSYKNAAAAWPPHSACRRDRKRRNTPREKRVRARRSAAEKRTRSIRRQYQIRGGEAVIRLPVPGIPVV